MPYKYSCEINAVEDCPPPDLVAEEKQAYRFVHNPMSAGCFIPVAKENPARVFRGKSTCLGLGLSLFTSREAAEKKRAELLRTHKNFCKRVGSCIAEGTILPAYGMCTQPSANGHFTLFEYDGITLEVVFSMCVEAEVANG